MQQAIKKNLGTKFVGQKVVYRRRVTSTMDLAREEARHGAPAGTVVLAEEQAGGRGRLKRPWLTPGGSLAFSIIFYPPIEYLPSLVMLAALAVARGIKAVTGREAQIKWPNDVLIEGKKVCGILIENSVQKDTMAYSIVGIGINANVRIAEFPEIASLATSLSNELGKEVSRLELLRCLLMEIEKLYLTLPGEAVFQEWRQKLVTLGRKVTVTSENDTLEGIAESVNRDGSLNICQPDGRLVRIFAGDVTLRADKK